MVEINYKEIDTTTVRTIVEFIIKQNSELLAFIEEQNINTDNIGISTIFTFENGEIVIDL